MTLGRDPRRRPRTPRAGVGRVGRDVARTVVTLDRAALRPGDAARVALGVALPLVGGLLIGLPTVGAAVAAGALSVGFVAMQGTYRSALTATVAAAVGMGLSTVLGALVDGRPVPAVLVTALLGLGAGLLVSLGAPATVTGIQCVVALLVVGQFDLGPAEAVGRGVQVLGGGLLQALLLVLPWPLRRAPAERSALERLYLSLAGYARSDVDSPPDPGALAAAGTALADPQPLLRAADLGGFGDLLAEGDRIRTSLATLTAAHARVRGGPVAAALERIGAASSEVLDAVAAAVRSGTVPADRAEDALREAGAAAGALREAGAAHHLVVVVDGLLGQLRQARRTSEALAAHAGSGPGPRQARGPQRVVTEALATLRANAGLSSAPFRHALRLAGGLAVASTVDQLSGSTHGYWLTLTVLVVLRPDFSATVTRGVARVVGTLAGVALATTLAGALSPTRPVLAALSITVAFLGYLLFQVNYAAFAACITSYIAFLLAFVGLPETSVALDRSVFTVGGGVLALAAYTVWPTWESTRLPALLAALLRAQGRYASEVLAGWADPPAGDATRRQETRAAARLARSNAEASVTRMLAEPHRSREVAPVVAEAVVAAGRRIALAVLALHAGRPAPDGAPGPVGTAELGRAVAQVLDAAAEAVERPGSRTVPDPRRLREAQVALAARLGVGSGARRAEGSGPVPEVPLLVEETDALVDAVGTLVAALATAAREPGPPAAEPGARLGG